MIWQEGYVLSLTTSFSLLNDRCGADTVLLFLVWSLHGMTVCMPRLAYAGILTGMPRLLNIERENKVHEIDVQHVCRYVPRVVYAGNLLECVCLSLQNAFVVRPYDLCMCYIDAQFDHVY